MIWLTVTEYLCHKWPRIRSVCLNHNPVLSSFMTYQWACNHINSTDVTSGAGTATLPEHLSSPPVFIVVLVARSLVFYAVFWKLLLLLLLLPLSGFHQTVDYSATFRCAHENKLHNLPPIKMFVLFRLAIVLAVLRLFTDSDYPFCVL